MQFPELVMHSLKVCDIYEKAEVMKAKNQLNETHSPHGATMKRLGGSSIVIGRAMVLAGAQRDLERCSRSRFIV